MRITNHRLPTKCRLRISSWDEFDQSSKNAYGDHKHAADLYRQSLFKQYEVIFRRDSILKGFSQGIGNPFSLLGRETGTFSQGASEFKGIERNGAHFKYPLARSQLEKRFYTKPQ